MVYCSTEQPVQMGLSAPAGTIASVEARRVGGPRSLAGVRVDTPGYDTLRWSPTPEGPLVSGIALGQVGRIPWHGQWTALFEPAFHLTALDVSGEADGQPIQFSLRRWAGDSWKIDGRHRADLDGCDAVALDIAPALTALTARKLGFGARRKEHRPLVDIAFLDMEAERGVHLFRSGKANGFQTDLMWWPPGETDGATIQFTPEGWPWDISGRWRQR